MTNDNQHEPFQAIIHSANPTLFSVLQYVVLIKIYLENYTLPETNIAPENGWLEDYFPFGKAYFQVLCWLWGGYSFNFPQFLGGPCLAPSSSVFESHWPRFHRWSYSAGLKPCASPSATVPFFEDPKGDCHRWWGQRKCGFQLKIQETSKWEPKFHLGKNHVQSSFLMLNPAKKWWLLLQWNIFHQIIHCKFSFVDFMRANFFGFHIAIWPAADCEPTPVIPQLSSYDKLQYVNFCILRMEKALVIMDAHESKNTHTHTPSILMNFIPALCLNCMIYPTSQDPQ